MGTRAHPVHAPESGIGKHGSTNSHGRGTLFRCGVGSRELWVLALFRHMQIVARRFMIAQLADSPGVI